MAIWKVFLALVGRIAEWRDDLNSAIKAFMR
jgi:hypothetical protein